MMHGSFFLYCSQLGSVSVLNAIYMFVIVLYLLFTQGNVNVIILNLFFLHSFMKFYSKLVLILVIN